MAEPAPQGAKLSVPGLGLCSVLDPRFRVRDVLARPPTGVGVHAQNRPRSAGRARRSALQRCQDARAGAARAGGARYGGSLREDQVTQRDHTGRAASDADLVWVLK